MQTSRRREAGGNVDRRSSNSTAGVTPNNIQSTDVRKEALAAFHVDLGPIDKQENKPLIKAQNVRSPSKAKKTPQQKMMAVAFYWCAHCASTLALISSHKLCEFTNPMMLSHHAIYQGVLIMFGLYQQIGDGWRRPESGCSSLHELDSIHYDRHMLCYFG